MSFFKRRQLAKERVIFLIGYNGFVEGVVAVVVVGDFAPQTLDLFLNLCCLG
jgi:hypothetical protein